MIAITKFSDRYFRREKFSDTDLVKKTCFCCKNHKKNSNLQTKFSKFSPAAGSRFVFLKNDIILSASWDQILRGARFLVIGENGEKTLDSPAFTHQLYETS